MQGLEIFNEVCSLALVYVMICFSNANVGLEYTVNYYDFAFLLGMGVNLIVHVYLLVKDSVLSIKDKIKAKFCKAKSVAKGPIMDSTAIPVKLSFSNVPIDLPEKKGSSDDQIEVQSNKLKTIKESENESSESS